MKPALLILDLQKQFFGGPNIPFFNSAASTINEALYLFRDKNAPVFWLRQAWNWNGREIPGRKREFINQLSPLPDETVIDKRYSNAFRDTGLSSLLDAEGAETLVIAGFRAQNCINETYCAAIELGYTPAVLKAGIASDSLYDIKMVESCCDTVSLRLLKTLLQ